jgi:hypothetical protein
VRDSCLILRAMLYYWVQWSVRVASYGNSGKSGCCRQVVYSGLLCFDDCAELCDRNLGCHVLLSSNAHDVPVQSHNIVILE